MKHSLTIAAGIVGAFAFVGAASAGDFAAKMDTCISKYANAKDSAKVVLECNAQGGKLGDCKVTELAGPKGFDKAAICVADAMPMGSKTGSITVPIRFPGGG